MANAFGLEPFDMGVVPKPEEGWEERIPFNERKRAKMYQIYIEKYEYRRAFSEIELMTAMGFGRLEKGVSYNFLTNGDVDFISFIDFILSMHKLDYGIFATWRMCGEDFMKIVDYWKKGRILRFDMRFGDYYPSNHQGEWEMIKDFFARHSDVGSVKTLKNHCKVFAGKNEAEDFYVTLQSSANSNTNPRSENACIQCDKGLFEFYRRFFDGRENG